MENQARDNTFFMVQTESIRQNLRNISENRRLNLSKLTWTSSVCVTPIRLIVGVAVLLLLTSGISLAVETAHAQAGICDGVSEISMLECEALVSLYQNTNEAGWTQRTNWMLSDNPCEWYGVTCQQGHVTVLALSNNNLSGPIPAEVGELRWLQVLDLAENNLSGSLPIELSNLGLLRWLYLNDNPLTGSLPVGFMNMDSLETLWLYNSQVCQPTHTSLQGWLGSLKDHQPSKQFCPVTATTVSVNIAPSPQTSCNDVTEIPVSECEALIFLFSNSNGIAWSNRENWAQNGSPCSWFGVTCAAEHVTELQLSNNGLDGTLPAQLSDLTELQVLNVSDNPLDGSIPAALTSLTRLTELNTTQTALCQPENNSLFQDWLGNIDTVSDVPLCSEVSALAVAEGEETDEVSEHAADEFSPPTAADMAENESETAPTTADLLANDKVEASESESMAETTTDSKSMAGSAEKAEAVTKSGAAMPQSGGVLADNNRLTLLIVGLLVVGVVGIGLRQAMAE